ncbi:retropepsin-like aspartic protease family protein [Rhizobium halophytocola]|uniref:Aspartyl protease family protein n=1 Tax=Rhizobium halophytocola TaxID=735519 RepID=A0ABS4DZ17_9HYPH|nr:TIGR02281 family clan AA aspartic protease [Rhizobium halophytocola]MBP1850932.1 aspartyl protease family protein [Rhizobium halophytocola]
MRDRFLILVFAILGIGLAILLYNNESGQSFGIANDRFGSMVALAPFAALLSIGVLRSGRLLPTRLLQLLVWVCVVVVLVAGYGYRDQLQDVGNRVMGELIPGRMEVARSGNGGQSVILRKRLGGHYKAEVTVGPATLPMLLDTGATSIALTYGDAIRAGIDPDSLSFTRTIYTANGRALAAPIRLPSVALGPIVRHDVTAVVTEEGQLQESLLGMSFLETLSAVEMRADRVTLKD